MDLFKQTKKDRDYLALQELLKPIEEQDEATGILSKPKKAEDEETVVTGFFSSVFDRSKQRSAELAKEMREQQRIAEQDINNYLRSTVISDALYDELKLPNPAYGGLKLVEDRPMTEEELQQYAPLLDLANDIMEENITVEELGAMNKSDQEAMLKSLGDLGSLKRGSSFEGDTFEVASSREEFMRDLMKLREKQNATTPDVDERSKLKEFLLREETNSTTADIEPVDTTTIDADGGAAPSGKGLMSPRLDSKGEKPLDSTSIMSAVRKADVTTDGVIDMTKVQDVITNNIGNNIHSAALLGAIKTEVGEGVKDEDPWYSVAGAKDVWPDPADVTKALNTLPAEQKARLLADEKSGTRTGGQASAADRKALGEAMWDIKYEGGKKYKGRGLIQITHKSNYEEVGKRIGLDLVKNPELVNDPKYAVAAAIAYMDYKGFFDLKTSDVTKNKLQKIVNPYAPTKVKNERWKYATEYLTQIRDEGGSSDTSPRPMLRPDEEEE
jgi:predicted chitinase